MSNDHYAAAAVAAGELAPADQRPEAVEPLDAQIATVHALLAVADEIRALRQALCGRTEVHPR